MIYLNAPAQLNYFLPEEEILEDLRIINKVSSKPVNRKAVTQNLPLTSCTDNMYEARIDDGRLYFDKRWSVVNFFLFGLFFFSFGYFAIWSWCIKFLPFTSSLVSWFCSTHFPSHVTTSDSFISSYVMSSPNLLQAG